MTPEHQQYLPAIAEHANEWVRYTPCVGLVWKKGCEAINTVRPTELLQLMQWIEEREKLDRDFSYRQELKAVCWKRNVTSYAARWHERWQAICKVKGWKPQAMMTLREMQLAVCEKLPELFEAHPSYGYIWKHSDRPDGLCGYFVHWSTEGLQVCHEAEKLLTASDWYEYDELLPLKKPQHIHATYEQRLEALCRVWWPERFV